ncbi:MAG: amidohydrolase [Deltaproteobacteria bacterium]|nr:amidohydrolase [Deltaproteobacteria bacterium]
MEIKHKLISADSHCGFDRNDFVERMSKVKWGDKIPQIVEVESKGEKIDRWSVYGEPRHGDVGNCPVLMTGPFPTYPKRYAEIPAAYHDPIARLPALDADGVDAEVLFPNPPGGTFYEPGDAHYELEVVQAYNDILSDWKRASDRYVPLAAVPYLSSPQAIKKEFERAAANGHRGINLHGQMPKGLPHITDPIWNPVWEVCQELQLPLHFHGSAGLSAGASVRKWDGYSVRQAHSAQTATSAVTPAQIVPQFIFPGITEKFPGLILVFPEAGVGSLNYVIAACDHEWESRHLWTEGIITRPSEVVRRQMYVNFWFEAEGIKLRDDIGVDNIMWESDFPHVASYYPHSWREVERVLEGVPEADRRKMQYENAVRLYKIDAKLPA